MRAEELAREAVNLLKKAQAAGFLAATRNVEHVKRDTDLEPLREREDFRKFLESLKTE